MILILRSSESIDATLASLSVDVLINASAYTAVDKAEEDTKRAMLLIRLPLRTWLLSVKLAVPLWCMCLPTMYLMATKVRLT